MDFKKLTRQSADRKYIQMLDGSTPPPYESDAEIDASRTYSSKRDRYYNRLSQEKSEFNNALSKVQSAEGARLRKEEADLEAKARSRYKLFKMLKTIAFLLPLVLVVFTGIDIWSNNYWHATDIDFEALWGYGAVVSVILAIILVISLYKKEIYYSRTNIKNKVAFSALAIIVTAVAILVGILFLATKPSISSKDDFVFMKGDRGCVLVEYKGDAEIVILPEEYEGEAYQISYGAFSGCTSLKSITIPDNIISIGYSAFDGCTSLTSITISDGEFLKGKVAFSGCPIETANIPTNAISYIPISKLKTVVINGGTEIGSSAFYNCTSLESVTIGNSVTSIGSYAFDGCTSLTSVTIPDSVTSIGDEAFRNCDSLKIVTIPDSVISIRNSVFKGCDSLTSVTMPNSVIEIGNYAFYGCTALTSVTIPNSVTSIGSYAFYDCPIKTATIPIKAISSISKSNLQTLVINGGDSIENYAFRDCDSLTSVTIGNSVTSIGYEAFYDCTSLTSITIGNSVTSIGGAAFNGCTSLKSVTIPDSVTSIGKYAFYNCTSLTEINFNATAMNDLSSDNFVFPYAGKNGDGIKVTIGKNVTKIPAYLFYPYYDEYSPKITSVVFEEGSVCESIGNSAFYDCDSLTSVNISDIASWCNISFGNTYSNPLYYAENLYLNGALVTELVIPNTVTEIKENAFRGYASLTSVTIGNGVTSIGDYAFSDCTSLTSVTIPDSVTSIGDYAFRNCDSLESVIIPDSVALIERDAFRDCDSLTIYCEAESQPSGWDSLWNYSDRPVVWGYTGE
ncbi:MAG: leucine-rich repeat protein [Clostridia bacterium]|nr:leucine-rich repeat protein [Clostridia bacterium]